MEIQRQSTSFAHRISSDQEEWRGARDFDYDDGRPSRVELAQEQAEDEFWDEKESDYPRGYGPPQTGDEEHDHPGWLYTDDEAPIPDEVTDADVEDLADEDDFDPYADEFVDGEPLPFGTPIYNPGGGYDDYDKTMNDLERQYDSDDGPDIEKFSAAREFTAAVNMADYIHEIGDNGLPRWITDSYDIQHAKALQDLGRHDDLAEFLAHKAYDRHVDLSLDENADENEQETWWARRCQTEEYEKAMQQGKLGGANPFDRREGMARRVGPGSYEHDTPYGTFGINHVKSTGYPGPAMWHLHPPEWHGQPGNPTDVFYTKAEALQAIQDMLDNPDLYDLTVPSPENLEYAKSLEIATERHHKVGWGNNTPPKPKPPKEPQKAVRNDDVKIMRDNETGLGYDVIVKPNDRGDGYDVVKVLGALKNSAEDWKEHLLKKNRVDELEDTMWEYRRRLRSPWTGRDLQPQLRGILQDLHREQQTLLKDLETVGKPHPFYIKGPRGYRKKKLGE